MLNINILEKGFAGLLVWIIIGIAGLTQSVEVAVWVLFIGTWSIVYLGLFISKFTGENFLDKNKPKNEFDKLFFFTVGQAVLVYSIAIPFFMLDYSSLPTICWNSYRFNVASIFMDYTTLSRYFSHDDSNGYNSCLMVWITRTQVRSHSICYCFDIYSDYNYP